MTAARRFYKDVTVTDDLCIALDGRPVKTPLKARLQLPARALADAVAAEWDAQGEKIDPSSMPFTKLANTAIDRVMPDRERIEADILDYANSDLVCYRADRPPALVARQTRFWDPVVDWARTVLDAPVSVRIGVMHQDQPDAVLAAFGSALASLNVFELAAFHTVMTLSGSSLTAMMLARGALSPEAAWTVAHVDEDYQIEQWGEDAEASARRAARWTEFSACCRFMALSKA